MLKEWFGGKDKAERPRRRYDVGWLLTWPKTGVIWDAPEPYKAEHPKPASAKSVAYCPAVVEFDRRHFVIPAPIDLHVRLSQTAEGKMQVTNVAGAESSIRASALSSMFAFMPQHEWRHPERPVVQIATPYLFVSDDQVTINQFPPYLHYRKTPMPGVQLCGRFPIDVWPRVLMWAFEWHDTKGDLILKRGEPWFYVRFETPDPSAHVRLFEAEMTPELERYTSQITDVTNYVNRTFSLFRKAAARRPKKLLVRRR